jgi:hypothetical protein
MRNAGSGTAASRGVLSSMPVVSEKPMKALAPLWRFFTCAPNTYPRALASYTSKSDVKPPLRVTVNRSGNVAPGAV